MTEHPTSVRRARRFALGSRVLIAVCLVAMATVTYLDNSWSRPAWFALLASGLLLLGVYYWSQRRIRHAEAHGHGPVAPTDE
jgi:hypothetical protein